MLKQIDQLIGQGHGDNLYIYLILNMSMTNNNNFDSQEFWGTILDYREKRFPDPKWISLYFARKELGINDNTIKKLNSEVINGKKLIRDKVNKKGVTEYAFEDVKIFAQFKSLFKDLEKLDAFKKRVIDGGSKYLVVEQYKKNQSAEKYKAELVGKLMNSFLGDIYSIKRKPLK